MPKKGKPVIEIKDLSAGYNSDVVIKNIDITIYNRDFLGIIGPNGGGKSTLLKVILGLLKPMKGSIKILGQDPVIGRRRVGYVPQFTSYDKDFPINVWDIVLMGRRSRRGILPFYSADDKLVAKKALQDVDMYEFRKQHINELSGGQRQRVFVARALCSEPKILLLDEPTASVDQKMQESIYELLKELNKKMTIILVTHDIGVLSAYIDRVACLSGTLFLNDDGNLSSDQLEAAYSCPVELIAHGVPHRVLAEHKH